MAGNGRSRFPASQRMDTQGSISSFISDHLRFTASGSASVTYRCSSPRCITNSVADPESHLRQHYFPLALGVLLLNLDELKRNSHGEFSACAARVTVLSFRCGFIPTRCENGLQSC